MTTTLHLCTGCDAELDASRFCTACDEVMPVYDWCADQTAVYARRPSRIETLVTLSRAHDHACLAAVEALPGLRAAA